RQGTARKSESRVGLVMPARLSVLWHVRACRSALTKKEFVGRPRGQDNLVGEAAPRQPGSRRDAMRLHLMLAVAIGLLAPSLVYAQTEEIQREVEVRLWIQRLLARFQTATGVPPVVSVVFVLTMLVMLLVVCIWLWRTRRNRATE